MDWTIQSRRYLVSDKKVEAVNYRKKKTILKSYKLQHSEHTA